ncbi:hypothetical protein QBC40DRAFT_299208 [Triangularia verruculosa]|uniref:Uncharacterized protein n=1 Tax=Triangularia verruculosa TaxID=2587418 RepID=A0AAN7AU46_9PEZI|nr:hypothetical protein QBC40DRAFT_299208 [Triangularia verruculosa]
MENSTAMPISSRSSQWFTSRPGVRERCPPASASWSASASYSFDSDSQPDDLTLSPLSSAPIDDDFHNSPQSTPDSPTNLETDEHLREHYIAWVEEKIGERSVRRGVRHEAPDAEFQCPGLGKPAPLAPFANAVLGREWVALANAWPVSGIPFLKSWAHCRDGGRSHRSEGRSKEAQRTDLVVRHLRLFQRGAWARVGALADARPVSGIHVLKELFAEVYRAST